MMKDKRVKGCPEPSCQKFSSKYKFKAEDKYCTACGSELVFVCAKCHGPIDDAEGPTHRICAGCEANNKDRVAKIQHGAKNVAAAVASVGAVAVGIIAKKK
jgi:hypothetical protein